MKIKNVAAKVAVIAAVLLGLLQGRASAASNPIPGIDIIVRKNPGSVSLTATSDKSGHFAFANLKAGKYKLSVNVPRTTAAITCIISSYSTSGDEESTDTVRVTPGRPASVEIKIPKDGGKITGTVVRADAPTKSGATPGQRTSKGAADPNHAMDAESTTR